MISLRVALIPARGSSSDSGEAGAGFGGDSGEAGGVGVLGGGMGILGDWAEPQIR